MGNEQIVAPSLLACDFTRMGEEIERMVKVGIHTLHLDFMDGHFVPNLSFGFPIAASVAKSFPEIKLDVHLMVQNPDDYLERLAELSVYQVSVHWETCQNLHRTLQRIRSLGMRAGVAFNPHSPLDGLEYLQDYLDNILIMTVNPGFGGQSFLPEMLPKIKAAAELSAKLRHRPWVSVDGGVNDATGRDCVLAGANFLVAGSYLFAHQNPSQAVGALLTPVRE